MISVVQTLCDRENFCELKALSISHAHIYLSLCLRLSPPLQNLRISLVVPPLPSVIDMRTSSATHYAGSSTINVDGEPAVHSEPPATLPTSGHVQKKVLVVCLDGTGDQVDADVSHDSSWTLDHVYKADVVELERGTILLHVGERSQWAADGLLPGTLYHCHY